jgi:hypothetical protein
MGTRRSELRPATARRRREGEGEANGRARVRDEGEVSMMPVEGHCGHVRHFVH